MPRTALGRVLSNRNKARSIPHGQQGHASKPRHKRRSVEGQDGEQMQFEFARGTILRSRPRGAVDPTNSTRTAAERAAISSATARPGKM